MTDTIHFHKMHGLGNDYIYVNTMLYNVSRPQDKAVEWSKPHTGIGSDGLVLLGKSDRADFSMRIFNADGSEALMCGNASRCIGKYVHDLHLTDKESITLETLSGIKTIKLHIVENQVRNVTVDMGEPSVSRDLTTVIANGTPYEGSIVSVGNPHFVIFVDDVSEVALADVGPLIEHHPLFPDRTNVEFVQVRDNNNVRMRVWERGSGITMACGTGACATLAACAVRGKTGKSATVEMDGGRLAILIDDSGHLQMTGDAVMVFEGDIRN